MRESVKGTGDNLRPVFTPEGKTDGGKREVKMEEEISRKSKIRYFITGAAAACLALAFLYFTFMYLPVRTESPGSPDSLSGYRKVKEIENLIQRYYLGDYDEGKLADYMYLGLVSGLEDQYSTYYTEEQYEELKKSQDGSYTGLGITLSQSSEDGGIYVVDCVEDSPAGRAGVQTGDQIVSVNGTAIEEMTTSEVIDLINSSSDGNVALELLREEKSLTLQMEMGTVEIQSVDSRMLEGQVGYIQITHFTGVTSQQFQDAYETLKEQGMEKLIIDLRDNPGGLVSAVCDTLRQILPEGVIVYTEDKNGNREEELCEGESPIDIPLAVLVNEESASASEIFAGAVKDYETGTLVGTTTFGKGIVQDLFTLSDGSVLRLTVSHYYTPKGNNIHGTGITPDVEVEQQEDGSTDAQLEKALEILGQEQD